MTLADLARFEAGAILPCLVPTFVRVVGAGPPVFVLHGGPGFSHDYLVEPLRRLAGRRSLVFFDQPGCGRSGHPGPDLDLDWTARHVRTLVGQLAAPGQPVGLLAHSWGGLVALAADLGAAGGVTLAEGLLITPVATRRSGWDRAVATLLDRIPPALTATIMADLGSARDTGFDPLLPFYCAGPVPAAAAGAIRVRGPTYAAILERLGAYDVGPQAGRTLPSVDLLLGRSDFTTADLLAEAIRTARATFVLDTGHFPFWEDPVGFEAVLREAFP